MHLLELLLFLFIIDIFVGVEIELHASLFASLLESRFSGNKILIKVAEYQTDIRHHTDTKRVSND